MTINAKQPLLPRGDLDSEDEEDQQCRICFEKAQNKDDPLIRPCKCTGSMRFTHKLCLQKWRRQSPNSTAVWKCEVCKADYITTTKTNQGNLWYFYVFPGLESLFYSCCISYVIGYFWLPGKEASSAEKAMCVPPFTLSREPIQSGPTSQLAQSNSLHTSIRTGGIGIFMNTTAQRHAGALISNVWDSEPKVNRTQPCTWNNVFRASCHWQRFFTGQYLLSLMSYTSTEVGFLFALDRYQFIVDWLLFLKFPGFMGWLFESVIFDYAPVLEHPIQMLLAGKIIFDFVRFTKSIYDVVLTEIYVPNYLPDISEVRNLDELER